MDLCKIPQKALDMVKIPVPFFEFTVFGVSFFFYKQFKFEVEAISTAPYELDGQTPLIYIDFMFLNIMFYNKFIYKYLYRYQNGYWPEGLE